MSFQLHEWDIHIECRGADDASGAAGAAAAAHDPPHQAGNFRERNSLGQPSQLRGSSDASTQ
jgi:hypothetical protein